MTNTANTDNTDNTATATPAIPVRFDVKARDNGDLCVRLDAESTMAVTGGYDALRLAASAKEDGRADDERVCREVVAHCAARAGIARTALIVAAGDGLKYAKNSRDREVVALLLKAAVRADKVAKAGGKRR